jgi:hypothetical protein
MTVETMVDSMETMNMAAMTDAMTGAREDFARADFDRVDNYCSAPD